MSMVPNDDRDEETRSELDASAASSDVVEKTRGKKKTVKKPKPPSGRMDRVKGFVRKLLLWVIGLAVVFGLGVGVAWFTLVRDIRTENNDLQSQVSTLEAERATIEESVRADCDAKIADIQAQADEAYFQDDFAGDYRWRVAEGEYTVTPGVEAVESPGHTAGHMSMLIELPKGPPILLAGDAADLHENIEQEIAPGLCWQEREDTAVDSIRKLKRIADQTGAELWPNHDMSFFRSRRRFPGFYE
ncbi:MAG: hypothetical protein P8Y78_13230 [Acidihalobacter sp.]